MDLNYNRGQERNRMLKPNNRQIRTHSNDQIYRITNSEQKQPNEQIYDIQQPNRSFQLMCESTRQRYLSYLQLISKLF